MKWKKGNQVEDEMKFWYCYDKIKNKQKSGLSYTFKSRKRILHENIASNSIPCILLQKKPKTLSFYYMNLNIG